jgi:hypothetical protein
VKRTDYGIAAAMAAGVIAFAWLAGGLGAPDLPVEQQRPAVEQPSQSVDDAAVADDPAGTRAPDWMIEALGGDTPRDARISEAYEFVTQSSGSWQPVTQEMGDALAEGDSPPNYLAVNYPWESCVIAETPNDQGLATLVVACPDGWVTTS